MKKLWFHERGNVTIEFAFVAPIFLLLVIGLFEFGRFYFTRVSMQYAIDEAGRFVMVNTAATDAAIEERIGQNLFAVQPEDVEVTLGSESHGGTTYRRIGVTHEFEFAVFGILGVAPLTIATETRVPLLS